jgi:hypothetical protein
LFDINFGKLQSANCKPHSEQIKTGHMFLSGTGGGRDSAEPTAGGRVTVAAVKSQCYTANEVTVDNYHGTLFYRPVK